MKWVLFTGSWRYTNAKMEKDVRDSVREVLERGDAIVTGGATGADYFVLDEAMKLEPTAVRLKVVLPGYLDNFIRDYHLNWRWKPVTEESIEKLGELLRKIKSAKEDAIIEMPYENITQERYNMHNSEEVKISAMVRAFQANDSTGTQDTIDKAKEAGLTIEVHKKYKISDEND